MGNGCVYSIFFKSTFVIYLLDKGDVKNKADESLPLEYILNFLVFRKMTCGILALVICGLLPFFSCLCTPIFILVGINYSVLMYSDLVLLKVSTLSEHSKYSLKNWSNFSKKLF